MGDRGAPDTRELITEGEKLRSDKKRRSPKTTQLVRESEQLIGRGPARGSSKAVVLALVFGVALAGAALLYYALF